MGRISDDDINGFSDLSTRRSRVNPMQQYGLNVLQGETTSPYGILAKGIAGVILGRQAAQQQAADLQERMRMARILQDHEDRGLDDDFTFKSFLNEYMRTGNKQYLNVAAKLKPAVAKSSDKTLQLARLANAKRTLISTKYGSVDLLNEQELAKAQADPEIMWIHKQIEEIVSGSELTAGLSPTTGTRQDTNQDVNGFEDLARLSRRAGIQIATDTDGKPRFLSQKELKRQKEKQPEGTALQDVMEGQIAKNPKTGQRIIRRGGKWQKL